MDALSNSEILKTCKIVQRFSCYNYFDFPYVGQAFVIVRECTNKKTGKLSREAAYCITSRTA